MKYSENNILQEFEIFINGGNSFIISEIFLFKGYLNHL